MKHLHLAPNPRDIDEVVKTKTLWHSARNISELDSRGRRDSKLGSVMLILEAFSILSWLGKDLPVTPGLRYPCHVCFPCQILQSGPATQRGEDEIRRDCEATRRIFQATTSPGIFYSDCTEIQLSMDSNAV
jgi:hypothetical protein